MNRKEILRLLTITIALCIIVFCTLIYAFNNGEVYNVSAARYITVTTTIVTSFWLLYFWLLWRIPLLNLIIYRPYIGGVWIGHGDSDYKENGNIVPQFKIALIIKQSFLKTKITGCSQTFHSNSYVESFVYKPEDPNKSLVYLYRSKRSTSTKIDGRSGASELQVFLGSEKVLKGDFWTQGGSTGFVKVYRKKKGMFEKIESFGDVSKKWSDPNEWK